MVHHLLKRDARPVAVRAQLLTAQRPGDVVETVRELTLLQIDPVKAVAPAQHLVLWSRLGSAYDPGELDRLLAERTLVEILGFVRPGEDVALYRAEMERWVLGVRSSPLRHRDPFDRLLLAQAQSLGATFMTADEQILAAGVAGVLDARTEGPGGT